MSLKKRLLVIGAAITVLAGGSGLIASVWSGKTDPAVQPGRRTASGVKASPDPQIAPASLSASSPSKELLYAGGQLIATEEPAACSVTISPTSASFPAASTSGGVQTGSVSVTSSCGWTAVSNSSFITITSGATGTGNGTVSYTVAVHTGTAIRNGTITIGGQTFTVFQGITFFDVPATHPFYTFIGKLNARGVTAGCGTGCNTSGIPCFCPDSTVTRAQMSIFVLRGMGVTPPTPTQQTFTDVPTSHFAYTFIEEINRRGIITGCGPTTFCPDALVSRADMAVFIERALGVFSPPTPQFQRFSDVPPSHSAYAFIDDFFLRGITAGCGNGCNPPQGMTCYCPADSVTRGQMAVFLVRAFNL
ncbi:MAG TPA: S-layer homology domain-containing protein [Blastocatellia bacterium]|nr:S-layer homology domain-containing protein [Blastocatellia bacterium]